MEMTYLQFLANYILNDFAGMLKKHGRTFKDNPVPPELFSPIVTLLYEKRINKYQAKKVIEALL